MQSHGTSHLLRLTGRHCLFNTELQVPSHCSRSAIGRQWQASHSSRAAPSPSQRRNNAPITSLGRSASLYSAPTYASSYIIQRHIASHAVARLALKSYSTRATQHRAPNAHESSSGNAKVIWPASVALLFALALSALQSSPALKAENEANETQEKQHANSAEAEASIREHDYDQDNRFAKSVEQMESEERRLRANTLVRWLYKTGDVIQVYFIEPLGTTKRFLVLVALFLPVLVSMPMLLVGRRREGGRRRGRRLDKQDGGTRWGALWWYGFLVKQMERAGPTFIKLAQWAGSRQDLFPKELCTLLGKLHSNGKPHSLAYTKKVIERVFGRPFDEVFEHFPDEPLGIGAVAQVYKAILRPDLLPPSYLEEKHNRSQANPLTEQLAISIDDERPPPQIPTASVAIKILHPKARRTIARDIRIMTFFAKLLDALPGAQWLSFPDEVEVFAEMMFSQLDLRNEAENLDRFERNFVKRGSAISFPRPLIAFTSKEVLIEEYEDAVPLKHFLNLGGGNFDHRIANLGLDAFLSMLLLDNFTHADLHPGNIMIKFYRPTTKSLLRNLFTRVLSRFEKDYSVSSDNVINIDDEADEKVVRQLSSVKHDQDAWLDELDRLDSLGYQPELVFLDAGLTVELSPTNRRNFLELFTAIAEFDGALAGHLMVERCRTPELVIDEDTFALKMQDLILSIKSKTFSLGKIKIGDLLSSVLSAVREHHVKMEADFVNTVISILLLEGIGRQLDPEMDVSDAGMIPQLVDMCAKWIDPFLSHSFGPVGQIRPTDLAQPRPRNGNAGRWRNAVASPRFEELVSNDQIVVLDGSTLLAPWSGGSNNRGRICSLRLVVDRCVDC